MFISLPSYRCLLVVIMTQMKWCDLKPNKYTWTFYPTLFFIQSCFPDVQAYCLYMCHVTSLSSQLAICSLKTEVLKTVRFCSWVKWFFPLSPEWYYFVSSVSTIIWPQVVFFLNDNENNWKRWLAVQLSCQHKHLICQ